MVEPKTPEKETPESVVTRINNCTKEVQEVLVKWGCAFEVRQGVTVITK